MALAEKTLREIDPSGEFASVQFKFTCDHCGERCTFMDDNTLYESGECHRCGKVTQVTHAGFALIMGTGKRSPADHVTN